MPWYFARRRPLRRFADRAKPVSPRAPLMAACEVTVVETEVPGGGHLACECFWR